MTAPTPTQEKPALLPLTRQERKKLAEIRTAIAACRAVCIGYVTGQQTHYVRINKSRALRMFREDPLNLGIRAYGPDTSQRILQVVNVYPHQAPDDRIVQYPQAMSFEAIT